MDFDILEYLYVTDQLEEKEESDEIQDEEDE